MLTIIVQFAQYERGCESACFCETYSTAAEPFDNLCKQSVSLYVFGIIITVHYHKSEQITYSNVRIASSRCSRPHFTKSRSNLQFVEKNAHIQ